VTVLSPPELLAAGAAACLAYAVFGFSGFGANLVALPLLAHVMSLRLAVPLLLLLDLFAAALMGARDSRLIERREVTRLLPLLLVGMVLGLFVLQRVAERELITLLGVFVGAVALWNLLGRAGTGPVSVHWVWPAGLVGGVFSGLFGTGGPLYTLYLARRIQDASRLRATAGALILGSALLRLLLFAGSGFFAQEGLFSLAAVLLPCALLGYGLGSALHARTPQAQVRRLIWTLLLLSAVSLLWRAAA
jgi:uncharacterized membrane protein YfcA